MAFESLEPGDDCVFGLFRDIKVDPVKESPGISDPSGSVITARKSEKYCSKSDSSLKAGTALLCNRSNDNYRSARPNRFGLADQGIAVERE